jgi:hypothetical protein
MVDKEALGQVFSEIFGIPYQYHSTAVFHSHVSSGGRSSETQSHPINMNNNITYPLWTRAKIGHHYVTIGFK